MRRILVLGANGQLARNTTRMLLLDPSVELTLYLRRSRRLRNPDPARASVIEGDVMDDEVLRSAMRGHDVVYANLSGDLGSQAKRIVAAMRATGLARLIFVASMGIYDEADETFGAILDPYREAAAVIEASDLAYTIVRPGWFTSERQIRYQLTQKGERFVGRDVTLDSVSDLLTKLALDPALHVRCSVGVSSP